MRSKWIRLLYFFLILGLADALYLVYHHYQVNILAPPEESFCVLSRTFDCDRAAASEGSKFLDIPVATLGVLAHLFLVFFLASTSIMFTGLRLQLYAIGYAVLLSMAVFSAYEAFISFFVIKAICIMCVGLYILIALMSICCKQALQMSHKEILHALISRFFSHSSWRETKAALGSLLVSVILSSSIAFFLDYSLRNAFISAWDGAALVP